MSPVSVLSPQTAQGGRLTEPRRRRLGRQSPTRPHSLSGTSRWTYCRGRVTAVSATAAWSREEQRAAWRAVESERGDALIKDPYARCLLQDLDAAIDHDPSRNATEYVLQARFLDEVAIRAANLHHNTRGDYNQVVLVGDALDTRPFRLLWPTGTVIYIVAPQQQQTHAAQRLKAQGAHVQRGCLLTRVSADSSGAFGASLAAAGFRADRPSVWVLQAAHDADPTQSQLHALMVEVAGCAGLGSLVFGELPPMPRKQAENLLAACGLLGTVTPLQHEGRAHGRWQDEWDLGPDQAQPWLIAAQQQRASEREMAIYAEHVEAAEAVGEDFEGNFS